MITYKAIAKNDLKTNVNSYLNLIKGWKYSVWTKDNFQIDLNKKWDFSFSTYDNNELVGFCIASNKMEDVYYIHLIFISDNYRGRSLGKKMLEHAKEIAKKNNVNRIELRCPESNLQALGFYQQAGFKTIQKIQDEISGPEADYYLVIKF